MQTPEEFLKANGFVMADEIDRQGMISTFLSEMEKGLKGEESSLMMIPTYVGVNGKIPEGAKAAVLDAGGTNFRGGIVTIPPAVADKQKSAQKAERPDMVATKQLYKIVRCPNYFGEIVFWTGVFISGLNILQGGQWIIAVFGYVCIVYIMFSGAKRLEKRQNKSYGDQQAYRDYVAKTPILIPFLPIYHLVKEETK